MSTGDAGKCISFVVQSCSERNIKATDVPAVITSALNAKHPNAFDVEWEKKSENNKTIYEAECKFKDKEIKAKFDGNGNGM